MRIERIIHSRSAGPSSAGHRRGAAGRRDRRWRIPAALPPLVLAWAAACAPQNRASAPETRAPTWDPVLAVDDRGAVYAAALTRDAEGTPCFLFAASAAAGTGWRIQDPAPFGRARGARRRPQLRGGWNGRVYALWEDSRSGPVDVFFNRSTDGGLTWLAADTRVNTNTVGLSHITVPQLAHDGRDGVVAVWRDDRDGFDALYSNASRDGGATWRQRDARITELTLSRKAEPRVACDDASAVYVTWVELRDGARHVFFNASSDAGETWMLQDIPVDAGMGGAFAAEIAALPGGTVLITWTSSTAGGERVYVARSTDRGRFWEQPRQLRDALLRSDASAPELVHDGRDHVYVGWHSRNFDGSSSILVAASEDRGSTFVTTRIDIEQPLEDPDPQGPHQGLRAPFHMAADETGNVYVTWVERAPGPRVRVDRLADYGRTWARLPASADFDFDPPLRPEPPQIACDDFGHVHLLWDAATTLRIATSPFYGASGWRLEAF